MTQLYIREQGAQIGRRGERLIVSKQGSVLDEFPLHQIEQVVLLGNVQLTAQATATLLERDVEVVFLSSHGKYRGRLASTGSKQVGLRQRQLALFGQAEAALAIGQAMIAGKINNQRVILLRQVRRLQETGAWSAVNQPQFEQSLREMAIMAEQTQTAADIDSLRGYEGKAAFYYFQALATLLPPTWGFEQRAYYPPPDPFNALLSFAYSLLLKEVLAAVHLVGFDPYLGVVHAVAHGRPSLALDLMEEWRPIVADALCLELVNRGTLQPDQFRWTGNLNRPVELGREGVEKVLAAYGQRLETKVAHRLAGGQTAVRHTLVWQARQLARVVQGQEAIYEPFLAR